MRRSVFALGLLAATGLASPVLANDSAQKAADDPNNWAMQRSDYSATGYSKLDQVNTKNVGTMKAAWTFSTGVLRGHEGSPIVIGSTMWLHTAFQNCVYALNLDGDPYTINWKYEPKQDPSVIPVMCCDTVNRGVQYGDGKIILAQADTTVVALDAKTGQPVWTLKNGDPKKGETMTAAPMVVKDKVIVGISGGEFGVPGHVTAYNLKDGSKAWR